MNSTPLHHVVIVGAGFSGTLMAINLLRHDGPSATLVERAAEPARGVAYSAAHEDHLLNVRASRMSAFPDDEDHFVRWLATNSAYSGASFVPRLVYGDYLADLLREAAQRSQGRLHVVRGDVEDVEMHGSRATARLADGRSVAGDAIVLALGNLPPHDPPGVDAEALPRDAYIRDPWSPSRTDGLTDEDTVLLLGTGLTMVDAALLLEAEGFRGRTIALSRRGLAPRRHVDGAAHPAALAERPPVSPVRLLHWVRQRAEAIGWRAAVDELRPFTQGLWRAAGERAQAQFLRHLRPWWDVHRHRLAPEIADRIEALRASGRLRIEAGKLVEARAEHGQLLVRWRPRGSDGTEMLRVKRIINCTGPQGDLRRTEEPLLRSLLESGMVRPDRHRLGLEVDANARVVDAGGHASPLLFALGPMTRGCFWEIVAVPDIRTQTWNVARYLSNAHWVGGEGL